MKTTKNESSMSTKSMAGIGPGVRSNRRTSMKRLVLAVIALSLGWVSAGTAATGTAEFFLPTVRASAGSSVATSIEFSTEGTAVSAILFDIQYDPSVLS